MGAKSRRVRKAEQSSRVAVEQGLFLTIGVPEGEKGRVQIKRAAEILQRHGYRVGVTSPQAILAAAELIQEDQKKLAEQATRPSTLEEDLRDAPHLRGLVPPGTKKELEPQPQGETDDGGDPQPA